MATDNGFFTSRRQGMAHGVAMFPAHELIKSLAWAAFLLLASIGAPAQAAPGPGKAACTREYAPVCADRVAPCIVPPCPLIRTTFSNACLARAAGAQIVYDGRCRGEDEGRTIKNASRRQHDPREPEKDPNCKSWTDGCNICRRKKPGGKPDCSDGPCGRMAPKRCLTYFKQQGKCR